MICTHLTHNKNHIFFILLHELHNPIQTHKCTQYFNIYMYTIYVYTSCICVCDERILKITKKNKMCRLILCARTHKHTHIRTQKGNSCLHNAAAQGRNDILRILLNAGAKITKNQVDRRVCVCVCVCVCARARVIRIHECLHLYCHLYCTGYYSICTYNTRGCTFIYPVYANAACIHFFFQE